MRASFAADVLVLQAGTDILLPDPLGKFRISTQLYLEIVEIVMCAAPTNADGRSRLLVLGGGGYHPLALARCWAGVWGLLSGRRLPETLPDAGRRALRATGWDEDADERYFENLFQRRIDAGQEGPIRPEIRRRVDRLLTTHPLFRGQ